MFSLLVAVLNHNNLVETEHQDDISFYTEQVYRQLQKNYPEYGINEEEIENTVKVMGGEDWEAWIQALVDADVLSDNAVTLAYSYIGPELTHAIYKEGSIGQAKKHLFDTSKKLTKAFEAKVL